MARLGRQRGRPSSRAGQGAGRVGGRSGDARLGRTSAAIPRTRADAARHLVRGWDAQRRRQLHSTAILPSAVIASPSSGNANRVTGAGPTSNRRCSSPRPAAGGTAWYCRSRQGPPPPIPPEQGDPDATQACMRVPLLKPGPQEGPPAPTAAAGGSPCSNRSRRRVPPLQSPGTATARHPRPAATAGLAHTWTSGPA
jgi:hypothetical protein